MVNWLSSREREAARKQPEITNDPPPVITVVTSEVPISQPLATLPLSQFGIPLNYFNSQTLIPTNEMVAQPS